MDDQNRSTNWKSNLLWAAGGFFGGYLTGRVHEASRQQPVSLFPIADSATEDRGDEEDIIYIENASPRVLQFVLAFVVQCVNYVNKRDDIVKMAYDELLLPDREKLDRALLAVKELDPSVDHVWEKGPLSTNVVPSGFDPGTLMTLAPPSWKDDGTEIEKTVAGIRLKYEQVVGTLANYGAGKIFPNDQWQGAELARAFTNLLLSGKPLFRKVAHRVIVEWEKERGDSAFDWYLFKYIFHPARGPSGHWCSDCGYFHVVEDDDLVRHREECPRCRRIYSFVSSDSTGLSILEYRQLLEAHRRGILRCSRCRYIPPPFEPVPPEFEFDSADSKCPKCNSPMQLLKHRD